MGSQAFVGEPAPAAVQPPGFGTRARRFLGQATVAVVAVGVLAGATMLSALTSPFHYADALIVVAVALLPTLTVLAGFFVRDRGLPVAFAAGGLAKSLRLLGVVLVAAIIVPGNLVLYANEQLDSSPAVIETAPVTETWIRTGKSGHRTYMAGVATGVASPLGNLSFYGAQPIIVARNDWTTIVPGRTRFVLRTHRGFFRLPWFEPHPVRVP